MHPKNQQKTNPQKTLSYKEGLGTYNKSGCVLPFGKDSIFGPELP